MCNICLTVFVCCFVIIIILLAFWAYKKYVKDSSLSIYCKKHPALNCLIIILIISGIVSVLEVCYPTWIPKERIEPLLNYLESIYIPFAIFAVGYRDDEIEKELKDI